MKSIIAARHCCQHLEGDVGEADADRVVMAETHDNGIHVRSCLALDILDTNDHDYVRGHPE